MSEPVQDVEPLALLEQTRVNFMSLAGHRRSGGFPDLITPEPHYPPPSTLNSHFSAALRDTFDNYNATRGPSPVTPCGYVRAVDGVVTLVFGEASGCPEASALVQVMSTTATVDKNTTHVVAEVLLARTVSPP